MNSKNVIKQLDQISDECLAVITEDAMSRMRSSCDYSMLSGTLYYKIHADGSFEHISPFDIYEANQ